jgi:hypothetical protein
MKYFESRINFGYLNAFICSRCILSASLSSSSFKNIYLTKKPKFYQLKSPNLNLTLQASIIAIEIESFGKLEFEYSFSTSSEPLKFEVKLFISDIDYKLRIVPSVF